MAYLRKPMQDEETEGQQTSFMSSQGPGMVGAGSGEGGLGVAGGPLTGRTPFINPEDISRGNVGAGQRLADRLSATFTKPAEAISSTIGGEQRAFEKEAQKQNLGWDLDKGTYSKDFQPLGSQVASTPMGLSADDIGELKRRLDLQYSGPQQFQASAEITDPLAKFKERVGTYAVGDPGTGIEKEGTRQSLIGEVMSPTSTGGKRSLEEYLLTSNPDALQSLVDTIRRTGRAEPLSADAPTTQFGGSQAVAAPVARLERARRELAKLVSDRQKMAKQQMAETRKGIEGGMGQIESGVSQDISDAIEAANRRKELISGGYVDPEERGEDFDILSQLPELFRGEYTDEEKQLAERLGLRTLDEETGEYTDQAAMAQEQLQRLLDPYGEHGFLDPEAYQGDEVTGVDYRTLDPLASLFRTINPESVYTPEQMIGEAESGRLAELQELIGPGGTAPITRAEDALGAAGRTIETDDVQSWLDRMAGFQEEKQQRADEIRQSRVQEEFDAKVGPPPQNTGNYAVDKENWFQYRQRIHAAAKEAAERGEQIEAYDDYKAAESEALKNYKNQPDKLEEFYKNNPSPPEPSQWDRFVAWNDAGYAEEKAEEVERAEAEIEALERIRRQKLYLPKPSKGRPSRTGWSSSNVPSGQAAPQTQAETGQYYA